MKFQTLVLCISLIIISLISLKFIHTEQLNRSLYHTTEEIDNEMNALLNGKCSGLLTQTLLRETKTAYNFNQDTINTFSKYLKYYTLTKPNNLKRPKIKIFILAGEHARELIAVELVLYFMKYICSNPKNIENILDTTEFRIIINSNPLGRQEVEAGNYCKRTNFNNIDLNRNWNIGWDTNEGNNGEQNPGSKPFSEVETTFTKDALEDFKPEVFLSIHSGVYGLFYPYASKMEEATYNISSIKTILSEVKSIFCQNCLIGQPSKLIGYKSPGNCMDYAYDVLKIPFSMAWEIYTNENVDDDDLIEIRKKEDNFANEINKANKTANNNTNIISEKINNTLNNINIDGNFNSANINGGSIGNSFGSNPNNGNFNNANGNNNNSNLNAYTDQFTANTNAINNMNIGMNNMQNIPTNMNNFNNGDNNYSNPQSSSPSSDSNSNNNSSYPDDITDFSIPSKLLDGPLSPENFISNDLSFLEIKVQSKLKSSLKSSLKSNMKLRSEIESIDSKNRDYTAEEKNTCLNLFNPNDRVGYEYIIGKWMKALVYMIKRVHNFYK